MPVYKYNNPTKDGRCWLFRVNYKDSLNNNRRYTSKKYATKFEAKEAERKFLNELDNNSNIPSKMTLGDLWDKYLEFQSDKVRINTRRSYIYTQESLKILFNIKCSEFNIAHYDKWKEYIASIDTMKTVTKNDKLKVLKAFLNFGEKRYGYNFHQVLLNMERFKNPDELVKEKAYYDIAEFDKFLASENEDRYRILWETLYYCGLRIGEARGLQWKYINWDNKTLWINKQVQSLDNYSSSYYVCNLKTSSSNRILTMCDALYEDLKKYYDNVSKYKNFNEDFFIFGNDKGLTPLTYKQAQRRKGEIANKAGIKEIRLHDFRHSCASFLVNNGAPVTMVSKYLGHSNSSETLNTYSHLFNTTSSEVINTINRARNTVEN